MGYAVRLHWRSQGFCSGIKIEIEFFRCTSLNRGMLIAAKVRVGGNKGGRTVLRDGHKSPGRPLDSRFAQAGLAAPAVVLLVTESRLADTIFEFLVISDE